jgi:hypothetical protein
MTEHDSWLTRDYDRRLDEEARYEAALEAETLRQREQLESAPVSTLLEQHDLLICKLRDITSGAPRLDGRVSVDLDSVIQTLAEQLAVAALAEPPEVDPPDDDDWDCDCFQGPSRS